MIQDRSRSLTSIGALRFFPLSRIHQLHYHLSRPQIVSEWKRNNDTPIIVRPKIQPQGLFFDNIPFDHFPVMMFGPHIADTAEETARRFSTVSRNGTSEKVTRALCSEFEFIEALSLEYTTGGPAVYAKLKHQDSKLPLGFISDGVHKLFSLLLGIAISSGGMVLIDQIEDGFYYKKFHSIWKLLYNFAKESDCQSIVTSHSSDAFRASFRRYAGINQIFRFSTLIEWPVC